MNYTHKVPCEQTKNQENLTTFLHIPCSLTGFHNTETTIKTAKSGREVLCFQGCLNLPDKQRICSCGANMHINSRSNISIRHLPFGKSLSVLYFPHYQLRCPRCGATKSQDISFKAHRHLISTQLYQYIRDLLERGTYTNKDIAELAGVGKNTVKAIDITRLREKYTIDGKKLKRPQRQARRLGIDEFKLHNGHKFATHIIDLDTGHILWIQEGKKKQVVYDFIDHVGKKWMKKVKAVACDMNSDFYEAFREKCPHIKIVFDYFHIVKNFNDKVVSEVRKDEQKRLSEQGQPELAKQLKQTRYILMSKRSTLQKKDKEAKEGRIVHKGSGLFKTYDITRKGGLEDKYDSLLKENKLLFTLDLVKEKLSVAYKSKKTEEMKKELIDIMDICNATGNKHFMWFAKLIKNHFEGMVAHAKYQISSGKVEGINQKIKTLRRHGYGYPDDEYFFLKIIDASRNSYVKYTPSHKICD